MATGSRAYAAWITSDGRTRCTAATTAPGSRRSAMTSGESRRRVRWVSPTTSVPTGAVRRSHVPSRPEAPVSAPSRRSRSHPTDHTSALPARRRTPKSAGPRKATPASSDAARRPIVREIRRSGPAAGPLRAQQKVQRAERRPARLLPDRAPLCLSPIAGSAPRPRWLDSH
jgi:hypothetical protein